MSQKAASAKVPQVTASELFSRVQRVRDSNPLVHCITNLVVVNFTANVLLATGAAPAMVVAVEEVGEFTPVASALSINVGTLEDRQVVSIRAAIESANEARKPWVLDPVAVGPLTYRTKFARELIEKHPAVIRGNASEIIGLAGGAASGRGPESAVSSEDAIENGKALARKTKAIVAITGKTDYITDGSSVAALENGAHVMTKVTGVGCALSATVAAFVGAASSPQGYFNATVAAIAYSSVCGQLAAAEAPLPGSFSVAYLDKLASVGAADFERTLSLREV